ncbi:oxidase [Tyrophagus putrescentiae]|nr:oxidase [Tyrophagus putrescentiae]
MTPLTHHVIFLLLPTVLLLLTTTANLGHSRLLYSTADCVNILTEGNATQFLSEGGVDGGIHLVLFYAGWCSHCRNMVPLFKQFIGRTKRAGWSSRLVDISVVACAEEDRKGKWSAVCRLYSVSSVPTFKLFPPRPNTTDVGTELSHNHSNQLQQQQCNKSQFPSEWPHFAPLYFEQLITLIDSEENQKTIVVVVEWPESLTGKELMLRFGDGSLQSQKLSLHRTVYRSWEDAEIIRWAPLLAGAGQLVPPFLLVMQQQQRYPRQLQFVIKPQEHPQAIKPEDEANYFGRFISERL